ncbi:hypothetical protein Q604_UNBC07345G0002 [human gut metagenome]|uniref:Uncharacterized protein n=1 Tax=human gut metagenome TaxID=408170 RepID=W1YBP2_9ZZZZ
MKKEYKSFSLDMIKDKNIEVISSKNALKDVAPINWSKDVLEGKKTVTVINLEK